MGYYVVEHGITNRDLYITEDIERAKIFKYNYEYTHYGVTCSIKHVEQEFLGFPKALFVEAAGYYVVDTITKELSQGYNWIYDYKIPTKPLKVEDNCILSQEGLRILKNEVRTESLPPKIDNDVTVNLVAIRYYLEYYIKTICGESPKELQTRIKKTNDGIIEKHLKEVQLC